MFKAFRQLWKFGLGRMDDGRINGMKKMGWHGSTQRKYTHSMFVRHKVHIALTGIEPTTTHTEVSASKLSHHHTSISCVVWVITLLYLDQHGVISYILLLGGMIYCNILRVWCELLLQTSRIMQKRNIAKSELKSILLLKEMKKAEIKERTIRENISRPQKGYWKKKRDQIDLCTKGIFFNIILRLELAFSFFPAILTLFHFIFQICTLTWYFWNLDIYSGNNGFLDLSHNLFLARFIYELYWIQ